MYYQSIHQTPQDPEFQQRVFNQFMDLYVTPEVMRRQELGELEKPLLLRAAQVLFSPDGRSVDVRINSEVRILTKPIYKPGISKNDGDPVYLEEIEGFDKFWLAEEDNPDCGYVILINLQGVWFMGFDFRRNKDLSLKHLTVAQHFFEAAEFCAENSYWSPFVDNLFSAAELAVKAELLPVHFHLREKRSHGAVHTQYNLYAKLGNVELAYRDTFNKLSQLRYPARYLERDLSITEQEANTCLSVVKEMIESAASQIGEIRLLLDETDCS